MVGISRILLICDDKPTSMYFRERLVVDGGYVVSFTAASSEGIEALKRDSFDVVLVKLGIPDLDGRELIRGLRRVDPDCVIIAFAEKEDPKLLSEISQGIYAFIIKPFNLEKLFFLIRKGLELHAAIAANRRLIHSLQEQNLSLLRQNSILVKRVEESTRNLTRLYEDLRSTYMRTIKVLAQTIDARDHYTHKHSENVAGISVVIADEMGLSAKAIELLREACELHDLGKIGIEDNILGKPSDLTEQEWGQIRRHPQIGAQILEPLTFLTGVVDLVKQHHEHYDGSGYPEGRKGEDILLGARIINLADAYEAMRSARSYRKESFSKEQAILEIKRNSGKQFDPRVVEAFLKVIDKLQ